MISRVGWRNVGKRWVRKDGQAMHYYCERGDSGGGEVAPDRGTADVIALRRPCCVRCVIAFREKTWPNVQRSFDLQVCDLHMQREKCGELHGLVTSTFRSLVVSSSSSMQNLDSHLNNGIAHKGTFPST